MLSMSKYDRKLKIYIRGYERIRSFLDILDAVNFVNTELSNCKNADY